MSKNVEDIATLTDILQNPTAWSQKRQSFLTDHLNKGWEGISIGFVDIEEWRLMEKDKDFDEKYNEQTVCLVVRKLLPLY